MHTPKIALIMLLVLFQSCGSEKQSQKKPNVLFIAVDDLRNELNCYGATQIHSPNFDKLASEGMIFQNAY